jgi:DNA mismatch repair protein MutS2
MNCKPCCTAFHALQVAAFCGTSMAAELLLTGALPIGSSQQQSRLLLQQTQEAADAQLEVTGAQQDCNAVDVSAFLNNPC